MPIYSETLSDEKLVAIIPKYDKYVMVIGCGACMNESLAYKLELPITLDLNSDVVSPNTTITELNTIKHLLEINGFEVEIVYFNNINGFLCMKDGNHDLYPISYKTSPDIILTLCCGAGYEAIRERFPAVKVVKITNQTALLFYSYKDKNGIRTTCKEQSPLMPLLFEHREEG